MKIIEETSTGFIVEIFFAEMKALIAIGPERQTAVKSGEDIPINEIIANSQKAITAHQPTEEDRRIAKDKALAAFNRDKAERLLKVETKGKELRAEFDRIKAQIEELHKALIERPDTGTDALADLTAERDALKEKAEDYSQIPGRQTLLDLKAGLERQIQALKDGVSQDKDVIQKEVDDLTAQLKEAKERADRFTRREQGEKRIEQLKAEEKKLAKEFEGLEQELYLCELFIKTKSALLTDRINSKFNFVTFKLFNQAINGGVEDCCEMLVNGVPFHIALNSGARTNAGLDVCRTLAQHYKLLAPIFVDNAESISRLMPMDAQVIRLVVSEGRWLPASLGLPPGAGDLKSKIEGGETFYFWPDNKLRVEMVEKTERKRVAA